MMKNRHATLSAVMLFLLREGSEGTEILLQLRQNTGYMDGHWDCAASGHVDAGESMKQAMVREAKEELDIDIQISDLSFAGIMHKHSDNNLIYYNGYFKATKYQGIPSIHEPDKCGDLQWFPLLQLPETLIVDRKIMLENYRNGIPYEEYQWGY